MYLITLFFLLTSLQVFAQEYANPIKTLYSISGVFGEMRTTHFHMGLDVRTQGKVGQPVYAIHDGYISFVSDMGSGYGKSLTIKHKNNIYSLYAHLNKFAKQIDEYMYNIKYEKQENHLSVALSDSVFKVKKGDLIGYSGNSGSSNGPHLHFEIFDKKKTYYNPLVFFKETKDIYPPTIKEIIIQKFDNATYVSKSKIRLYKKNNIYITNNKIEADGEIKMSILADDIINPKSFRVIPYKIYLYVDDSLIYRVKFDKLNNKYKTLVSGSLHYPKYLKEKKRYINIFDNQNNSVFQSLNKHPGIIKINKDKKITIKVCDINLNCSYSKFVINYLPNKYSASRKDNFKLFIDEEYPKTISNKKIIVTIPKNALYDEEDINIEIKDKTPESNFIIGNKNIPIAKPLTIKYLMSKKQTEFKKKTYIYRVDNKPKPLKTYLVQDTLKAKTKHLGVFSVDIDTLPPIIKLVNLLDNKIFLYAKDKQTGIKKLNAYLNGKWVMCSNKKNIYNCELRKDYIINNSTQILTIETEDNVGNIAYFRKLIINNSFE